METIGRAARGPKRRGFPVDGDVPVEASHALSGPGRYEYGSFAVHRKRLPGAPEHDPQSYYFAFDKRRSGAAEIVEIVDRHHAETTRTHAMAQAVLCDRRFVHCRIDGEPFWAELGDVVAEPAQAFDAVFLDEPPRADVVAQVIRSSDERLNGRALEVHIAVTNVACAYEEIGELMYAGRPCLELAVLRDLDAEADPHALEAHVCAGLLSGGFAARWIVAPAGTHARVKPVGAVRRLLERRRTQAEVEIIRAQHDPAAAAELHPEADIEQVEEYQRKLDDLETAGTRDLLFPPGTTLRSTIAYEHRRRFTVTNT
ncbi:MAG: hypothetical protein JO036_12865 [Candidatus Eremiobacteraeota bacterium]|nr:hypothetical protein [Candidatus Eremiobacteraeota bacterium]